MLPIVMVVGLAFSQLMRTSFAIYLKYQGLVDGYYQFKLRHKFDDGVATKSASQIKREEASNKVFQQSLRAITDAEIAAMK